MTTFNILFAFHRFASLVVCFATGATILGMAGGARPTRRHRILSGLLFLFFAGTTGLAWWLQRAGHEGIATGMLALIWVGVIGGTVYAAGKARWN